MKIKEIKNDIQFANTGKTSEVKVNLKHDSLGLLHVILMISMKKNDNSEF